MEEEARVIRASSRAESRYNASMEKEKRREKR
jgi:hypothetical protein